MIGVRLRLPFVENIRRNYVKGAPDWAEKMLEGEYSPFRAYLDQLEPGVDVVLTVGLQVDESSRIKK